MSSLWLRAAEHRKGVDWCLLTFFSLFLVVRNGEFPDWLPNTLDCKSSDGSFDSGDVTGLRALYEFGVSFGDILIDLHAWKCASVQNLGAGIFVETAGTGHPCQNLTWRQHLLICTHLLCFLWLWPTSGSCGERPWTCSLPLPTCKFPSLNFVCVWQKKSGNSSKWCKIYKAAWCL